ncbi:carboxymuconolactone decarboxylase family protein [Saxibacter everestensis]|uniref:Carboxymuconolactone decarboxylase family protein n=1 Tax=Saxibacter everestensis TaxID=2909229 RepID=A0ABY8QS50_9MICO|nr:carboxymuconolactone decarboxylase family protein [Brevibacteriaceae bacterium ZFBP1038]
MSTAAVFTPYTSENAPEQARGRVQAAEKSFGFVPRPVGLMAESPELLEGFLTLNGIFNKCSLSRLEREVLILTIATRVECHYCVAMHSAMLAKSGTDPELISALRKAAPLSDGRLEAMRQFTLQVMDKNGDVSDQELAAFLGAGYTSRSALDVVLGLGTYTLSTAANRMTRAELDPPFEAFTWHQH